MDGAKNLSGYLSKTDKHGVAFGSWAEQKQEGVAECKFCFTEIKFAKGIGPLGREAYPWYVEEWW